MRNSNRNFREIPRESFELRRNLSFSFRSGISRSEIENFPTEDHEGVQIGSGGNPDNNERRRELSEFILIHRMFRSSFVARKQRIFDGIHNRRKMDGGKNPQAKTEPKERNFCFLTFGSAGFPRKSVLAEKKWKKFVCLLRAPFPLRNSGGGSWGFCAGCVCFLLRL